MSKTNDQWFDAMQRAWVTQEDCTCPSDGATYGRPHDDDCPVTKLRQDLAHWEPEYSRTERFMLAGGKVVDPPAKWLIARLDGVNALLVWLAVEALWIFWTWTNDGPLWWSLATSVVTIYLGGLGGSILAQVLIARSRWNVDGE